jgi:putative ABC transport system ATP-binding protein
LLRLGHEPVKPGRLGAGPPRETEFAFDLGGSKVLHGRAVAIGDGQAFQALDEVSFDIARGEMVAIMGPSGSGKSTLMNIIGLLDVPTSGSYLLDGEDVSELDRTRQAQVRNARIGFVFQNFNLLPRMTALANVALPLVYGRVSAREREERARAALAAVGLDTKAASLPNQLSGGQKQRVAIARALVTEPSLLLADEPTGALDTRTGSEILELFRRLNEDRGVTLVVITHDAEVGRQMDRVIGLRDGRLVPQILETYYGVVAGARVAA